MQRIKFPILAALLISMTILNFLLTPRVSFAAPPTRNQSTQILSNPIKAIFYEDEVILNNLPSPTFSALKAAGFNLLGTAVFDTYGSSEWSTISDWIQTVHQAGFNAFIMVASTSTPDNYAAWVQRAASIGADIVNLDELMTTLNQKSLTQVLTAGFNVNPNLGYVITEWDPQLVKKAFHWTSDMSSVCVADDDYSHIEMIDYEIQLATKYNKRPLVWLQFTPGSQLFDCYANFDTWVQTAKQRGVDAQFWRIDSTGYWVQNWPLVASYNLITYYF